MLQNNIFHLEIVTIYLAISRMEWDTYGLI